MTNSNKPNLNYLRNGHPYIPWKFKLILCTLHSTFSKTIIWIYTSIFIFTYFLTYIVMSTYEDAAVFRDPVTFTYWFFTTISTVGYGDFSPVTVPGRIITIFLFIIGISTFSMIAAVSFNTLFNIKQKALKGLINPMNQNHIVILGYQKTVTPHILKELLADKTDKRKIVIVDNDLNENPFPGDVQFIKGDITKSETHARANVEKANKVMIRCVDDATALLTTLTAFKNNKTSEIIVYLSDEEMMENLEGLSPNIKLIVSSSTNLMVQELQDPGVSHVIHDLLSNINGSCALYKIPNPFSEVKTFYEASSQLKGLHELTLISVERDNKVINNPPSKYKLTAKDSLFVIAEKRPNLSKIAST